MTPISVTMRSTQCTAVSGRVQVGRILGSPRWVCSMATMTRFAPTTRSIAPPIPGTILPGMIQLARLPAASTCRAPSTVASTWPPRIRVKEVTESMKAPPSRIEAGLPPASTT